VSRREAPIVSTARTPIGRAFRGAFNNTHGAVLAGHVVSHAIARGGIDPPEVEDVVIGCAMPEGATGMEELEYYAYDCAAVAAITLPALVDRVAASAPGVRWIVTTRTDPGVAPVRLQGAARDRALEGVPRSTLNKVSKKDLRALLAEPGIAV
jgi:acetyl-CoA C-acetyltransferase